jgi:uncharacterized membrane protein YgcG
VGHLEWGVNLMRLIGVLVALTGVIASGQGAWQRRESARLGLELAWSECGAFKARSNGVGQNAQAEIAHIRQEELSQRANLQDYKRGLEITLLKLRNARESSGMSGTGKNYEQSLVALANKQRELISITDALIAHEEERLAQNEELVSLSDRLDAQKIVVDTKCEARIASNQRVLAASEELLRFSLDLPQSAAPQLNKFLQFVDRSEAPAELKKELIDQVRGRAEEASDSLIDRYIPGGDNRAAKNIAHAIIEMNPIGVARSSLTPSEVNTAQGMPPAPGSVVPATGKNDPLGGTTAPQAHGTWAGPDRPRMDTLFADRNYPTATTVRDSPPSRDASPSSGGGSGGSQGGGGHDSGGSHGGGFSGGMGGNVR